MTPPRHPDTPLPRHDHARARLDLAPPIAPTLLRSYAPTLLRSHGFTLTELLIVIAIIAILSALLLPALGSAAERGRQTSCLSNTKQLALAWQMYSDDHGKLPLNGFVWERGNTNTPYWVQGYLNHGRSSDATNTSLLTDPRFAQFAPYIAAARVYRCPSDRKPFWVRSVNTPKVRSYSLNGFLGWNFSDGSAPPGRAALRESDISRPSQMLSFVDVRSDSMCWPFFGINGDESFFMFPAAYHGRAANLVFADGHSERKRWRDPRTYQPPEQPWHEHDQNSPGNADLRFLRSVATERFGVFTPSDPTQ